VAARPHYPLECVNTHTHTHRKWGGCVDQRTMLAVHANRRSSKHVSYTTLSTPNKPLSLTSIPNFKPRLHQESTPLFSRMKKKTKQKKVAAEKRVSSTDSPFPLTADCREETAQVSFSPSDKLSSIQVCLCTVLELGQR